MESAQVSDLSTSTVQDCFACSRNAAENHTMQGNGHEEKSGYVMQDILQSGNTVQEDCERSSRRASTLVGCRGIRVPSAGWQWETDSTTTVQTLGGSTTSQSTSADPSTQNLITSSYGESWLRNQKTGSHNRQWAEC